MERKKVNPQPAKPQSQFAVAPTNTEVELATYRRMLLIDKYKMDEMVAQQPGIMADVAENLVYAESRRDMAKENLKTVDAKTRLALVDSVEKKETDKVLDARVQVSPEHAAAFKALLIAEKEVGEWQALRDAWKDRSYMLREMALMVHDERAGAPSITQTELERRVSGNRQAMMKKGGY